MAWLRLPADWSAAARIGHNRQGLYRDGAGKTIRTRPDDPTRENIIGAVAEKAFADATGLPRPRFKTDALQGDAGYDFETAIGRIDVKGCKARPWYLGVKNSALQKPTPADWYVLLFCPTQQPSCWLVGYAAREELLAGAACASILDPKGTRGWASDPRNRALDPEPGHWLPVERLRSGRTLLERLKPAPAMLTVSDIQW